MKTAVQYIIKRGLFCGKITQWFEDMNSLFSCVEKSIFNYSLDVLVRENIVFPTQKKIISSCQFVMYFMKHWIIE